MIMRRRRGSAVVSQQVQPVSCSAALPGVACCSAPLRRLALAWGSAACQGRQSGAAPLADPAHMAVLLQATRGEAYIG